jgi:hypothetical protein
MISMSDHHMKCLSLICMQATKDTKKLKLNNMREISLHETTKLRKMKKEMDMRLK